MDAENIIVTDAGADSGTSLSGNSALYSADAIATQGIRMLVTESTVGQTIPAVGIVDFYGNAVAGQSEAGLPVLFNYVLSVNETVDGSRQRVRCEGPGLAAYPLLRRYDTVLSAGHLPPPRGRRGCRTRRV